MTTLILQPGAAEGMDTMITDVTGEEDWDNGAGIQIGVQNDPDNAKALIRFDLSGIPVGTVITSAVLSLKCFDSAPGVEVHRSLVEWFEGGTGVDAPPVGDGSTWNYRNYNGSVAWGAAGGLADTDYEADVTDLIAVVDGDWAEFDVLADVQDFVDGTADNYGWWLLPETGETVGTYFIASDNVWTGWRPKLTIVYGDANPWTTLTLDEDDCTDTGIGTEGGSLENMNYGASTTFGATNDDPNFGKGLIRFDISALPANATIISATLKLFGQWDGGDNGALVTVHRALTQWFEGVEDEAEPVAAGSTWDYRNHFNATAWGAEGGLAGTDYATVGTDTVVYGQGVWHEWDVLADVSDFHSGAATNYGWWLTVNAGGVTFLSSEHVVQDEERPRLIITYTTGGGLLSHPGMAGGING